MSRSYTSTPNRVQIKPTIPLDEEGGIICPGHKRRANLRKAGPHTKNAGRMFYCCPLPQGDQCKFFLWEDEADGKAKDQGRTLATPPQTPSRVKPATVMSAPPAATSGDSEDDIDWSQVDTQKLEQEAIASTPGSSQASQPTPHVTPFQSRLLSVASEGLKRKREDDDTPRKAPENPFLSSPGGGAPSSQTFLTALETLGDLPDHIRRLERLLAAAEKGKEGFRRTIKQRDERIRELEERVNELGG